MTDTSRPSPLLDGAPTSSGQVWVKVGVYCLRGGGHFDTYDEEEGGRCGTTGPDVFIAAGLCDYAMYPEWLQCLIHSAIRGDG